MDLAEFYGEDGLPKKCTQCLKDRTQISFPAYDQPKPICFDCCQEIHFMEKIEK